MSVMESRGKRDMRGFFFQHLIYYGYTLSVYQSQHIGNRRTSHTAHSSQ